MRLTRATNRSGMLPHRVRIQDRERTGDMREIFKRYDAVVSSRGKAAFEEPPMTERVYTRAKERSAKSRCGSRGRRKRG